MSITVEELRNMNPDTYQLIDIRSESEIAHGAIPGHFWVTWVKN